MLNTSDLPPALQGLLGWAPAWAVGLTLIAVALAAALLLHELIVRGLRRGLRRRGEFTRSLVVRTRAPGRFALMVAALAWASDVAPITAGQARTLQHVLLVAFIVLVGWAALTALDIGASLYMRRYRIDVADNLQARKHLTQVRILRRAVGILVVLLTVGIALMTVPGVKQVGVSLLAAGGAAGIIVGLALQPVLSNVMAGVQIALTQPIRIDDAVVIQGEFGNVEEIGSTYVVIRLWDQRRMIVPLKYFLEQPFQNWTRESADLLGTVMLYADYRVSADLARARLEQVLRASSLWDGKVCALQVTDMKEQALELRALVSARNAGELFALRCEVRERMAAWLHTELSDALPRTRLEMEGAAPALHERRDVQHQDVRAQ